MAPSDYSGSDSDLLRSFDMKVGDEAESRAYLCSRRSGMSYDDVIMRLKEAFGSDFCSSRMDEIDSICHIVYGPQDLQSQEALLQTIHDSKAVLIHSPCPTRMIARLRWSCGIGSGSGHSANDCPASDSAATADLEQAEWPAGSASTKAIAGKKAKKRAKQAAKRAAAEKAATATNGSSIMADGELSEAAATSVAAPDDAASVVRSADGGTADAAADTEQPEQKEHAERGHIHSAASKETGDADSEQPRCYSDLHIVMLSATTGKSTTDDKLRQNAYSLC